MSSCFLALLLTGSLLELEKRKGLTKFKLLFLALKISWHSCSRATVEAEGLCVIVFQDVWLGVLKTRL